MGDSLNQVKKEDREWAALRLVYNDGMFADVFHQDQPDFVLGHHGAGQSFGVEVTDLYESESDARAAQHPGYIGQLLAGESPMHKDDAMVFEVVPVEIHDSEGSLKAAGVPAIVRPLATHAQRAEAVAAVLKRKSTQARGYAAVLSHINLIIVDRFSAGQEAPTEYSTRELLTPELRTALVQSPFREVYLTGLSGTHQIYRPLQMLVLAESFFLFLGALDSFLPEVSPFDVADVVPLFTQMSSEGALDLRLGLGAGTPLCAVYRGAGITYSNEGIRLLDFADQDLPPSTEVLAPTLDSAWIAAFKAHYATFAQENHFVTELAFPSPGEPRRRTGRQATSQV